MSNPNFVNDLVMMAKAFEELPTVKAELDTARNDINGYLATIQRLELRLIDRANEIDNLNAKVRTVEVERDHAETMFLETDGKLDAAKSVLSTLMGNAGAFLQAVEPPKPEPVAEPKFDDGGPYNEPQGQSEPHPTEPSVSTTGPSSTESVEQDQRDATPTAHWQEASHSQPSSAPDVGAVSAESAASSTTGESAADPTPANTPTAEIGAQEVSVNDTATPTDHATGEGVSVSSDPTLATESFSTNVSSVLASPPEPELRYSPEWYQWADAVGYWDRKEAAQ